MPWLYTDGAPVALRCHISVTRLLNEDKTLSNISSLQFLASISATEMSGATVARNVSS